MKAQLALTERQRDAQTRTNFPLSSSIQCVDFEDLISILENLALVRHNGTIHLL